MNNGRNDTPDVLTFPLNIWGKKGESIHLLEYHLIDVASVCHMYLEHDSRIKKILAESLGVPPSTAINLLRYLCSIHDIGKVCPDFQESVESIIKYRHDLGGYYIVTEHKDLFNQVTSTISLENNDRKIRRRLHTLLRATTLHHGSPRGWDSDRLTDCGNILSKSDISLYRARVICDHMMSIYGNLDDNTIQILKSDNFDRLSNIFAGIINQCDWIASGEFDHHDDIMSLEEYRIISETRAKELFDKDYLGIMLKSTLDRGFKEIFNFSPSPLQKVMSEIDVSDYGLYIIEDATGAGKTEASLYLSLKLIDTHNLDGLTFALPTRSTSNLMFKRLNSYSNSLINESTVSLQHGSSRAFLDNEGIEPDKKWIFGKNKSLFANISVCTVDQILSACIPTRYQPLKLLSLIRHVLIIDEVHAYDGYTFALICNLVKYCKIYGIPIILLSATLPSRMKKMLLQNHDCENIPLLPDYPLLTICRKDVSQIPCDCSARSTRSIKLRYLSDENLILQEIVDLASRGYRVCWIRNTVDDAIKTYKSLPPIKCKKLLIHSRFIQADRINKEQELFSLCGKGVEHSGLIVIGTQVIEQSLDIGFERVYSDLAPIDSLIQRMGRDQRFDTYDIECQFIINGPKLTENISSSWYSDYFETGAFVYRDHDVLYRTAELMNVDSISIPSDYRKMIEYAYAGPSDDSPFFENHQEFMKNTDLSIMSSNRVVLKSDMCYGCSIAEDFGDNQWDSLERVRTRESDDKTSQCLVLIKDSEKWRPFTGTADTSLIILRNKSIQENCIDETYNEKKWTFIKKVRATLDVSGQYWMIGNNIRYTKDRGAEYV